MAEKIRTFGTVIHHIAKDLVVGIRKRRDTLMLDLIEPVLCGRRRRWFLARQLGVQAIVCLEVEPGGKLLLNAVNKSFDLGHKATRAKACLGKVRQGQNWQQDSAVEGLHDEGHRR